VSAAFPLTSIRNGPISQSPGIARTRKNTAIRPPKNSRNPNRRRRRRSGSSAGNDTKLTGTRAATGSLATMIGSATGSVTGSATGSTTDSAMGSAVAAGGVGRASWTAGFVSAASDKIGAGASVGAGPPVSRASRSCSFA